MKVYVVLRNEDRTELCLTTAEAMEKHPVSPAFRDTDTGEPLEPFLSFKARSWQSAKNRYNRLFDVLWEQDR